VNCFSQSDWWITLVSGPCDGSTPPTKVAVGEKFIADGKTRKIGVMLASQAEHDMLDYGLELNEG
jgi:hypothetical protein